MIPEAEALNANLTFEEREFLDEYALEGRDRYVQTLVEKYPEVVKHWPSHMAWPPEPGVVDLGGYIHVWHHVVDRVERGYPVLLLEEYVNDLTYRNTLEDFIVLGPSTLAEKLTELLTPLDERFRAATVEVGRPLYSAPGSGGAAWWLTRVPAAPEPRLKEGLIETGFWPPS